MKSDILDNIHIDNSQYTIEKKKYKPRLIYIAFLVFVIFLGYLSKEAISEYADYRDKVDGMKRTYAEVVKVEEKEDSDICYVYFDYTVDGTEYKNEFYYAEDGKWRVGDKMYIYYIEGLPMIVVEVHHSVFDVIGCVVATVIVGFILIALIIIDIDDVRINNYLYKHGVYINAVVTDISYYYGGKYRNCPRYKLVCEAEYNGKMCTFMEANMSYAPKHKIGDYVKVCVGRNNPKKYHIFIKGDLPEPVKKLYEEYNKSKEN